MQGTSWRRENKHKTKTAIKDCDGVRLKFRAWTWGYLKYSNHDQPARNWSSQSCSWRVSEIELFCSNFPCSRTWRCSNFSVVAVEANRVKANPAAVGSNPLQSSSIKQIKNRFKNCKTNRHIATATDITIYMTKIKLRVKKQVTSQDMTL